MVPCSPDQATCSEESGGIAGVGIAIGPGPEHFTRFQREGPGAAAGQEHDVVIQNRVSIFGFLDITAPQLFAAFQRQAYQFIFVQVADPSAADDQRVAGNGPDRFFPEDSSTVGVGGNYMCAATILIAGQLRAED